MRHSCDDLTALPPRRIVCFPTYKRRPARVPTAQGRAVRAAECDELIARMAGLADADPPLLLSSHPVSRRLLDEPSPQRAADYKHREDLIDALLCAWTAALWSRHGSARCQILGADDPAPPGCAPTITAPARPEQRRDRVPSPQVTSRDSRSIGSGQ